MLLTMPTLGINITDIQALVKKLLKKRVVPRYHDTCQCVQELMNTVIELHSGRAIHASRCVARK